MRNNIGKAAIGHAKAAGDDRHFGEPELLIQRQSGSVGCHDRIKLQNAKAECLCLLQAVAHKRFTDMPAPCRRGDSIRSVANMPASAHIVGVQDVKTAHSSSFYPNARVALGEKEGIGFGRGEAAFLREGIACAHNLISHLRRLRGILALVRDNHWGFLSVNSNLAELN